MRESGRNLMFSYGGEIESAGNLNSEGGSFEVGVEGGERDQKKIDGVDWDFILFMEFGILDVFYGVKCGGNLL